MSSIARANVTDETDSLFLYSRAKLGQQQPVDVVRRAAESVGNETRYREPLEPWEFQSLRSYQSRVSEIGPIFYKVQLLHGTDNESLAGRSVSEVTAVCSALLLVDRASREAPDHPIHLIILCLEANISVPYAAIAPAANTTAFTGEYSFRESIIHIRPRGKTYINKHYRENARPRSW